MIAVDTNVLVYAHREDMPFHQAAAARLAELLNSNQAWAVAWSCIHEFLGVVTSAKTFKTPTPLAQAIAAVEAWMESPRLSLLGESPEHWPELQRLLRAGHIMGPMVHDARIAALCLQHGVRELWTADRDFQRFPALRTVNPLITP